MIDTSLARPGRQHSTPWRYFATASILLVVLLAGVSPRSESQETDTGNPVDPESPLNDDEDQEEIVVVGSRVEGGGRRADASREQLEATFETDMEGFFDDIAGLSTLGGDGEGNVFSIDGLSPDLGKVSLDGQGFGQGRGNGGIGAGDIPPEMVLRVNVHRSPVAAMEEGGAAGRVNLQMRNPVDMTKPANTLKGKFGYVPETNDFNPAASYFAGRRAESGTFGYMLSISATGRENHAGSQDVSSWTPFDSGDTTADIPTQIRNNAVAADQGNFFAGLGLGFRPRPSLNIKGKILFARKDKDSENQGLQHRIERQRDLSVLDYNERIVTELDSSDDSRSNLRVVGSTRSDRNDSAVLGVDVDWRKSDWRVEGALGYSVAENESDRPSHTVNFAANSPFGYIVTSNKSLITSYSDAFPADDAFVANRVNLTERATKDTNSYGGIDLTRQMGERAVRRVQFGVKLRELTRERRSLKGEASVGDLSLSGANGGRALQTPWDTAAWPTVDMGAVDLIVQESEVDWETDLLNEHDIEQRISAGYVQADFRVERDNERFFAGNVGARIVRTETWIDGFQDLGAGPEPVSLKTSYSDFLPSASTRMRVAQRAAIIVGVAKVMTRPPFNDLAPGIRFNFSEKTAKSGNPELLPFRANQFLVEAAWAPVRGLRLNGNVTYRDVENFFALGEETIEVNDDTYLLTRPVNGGDGSILSAGMRLQQSLRRLSSHLRNFTLSLSWTHNRSSTDFRDPVSDERLPLPNTATDVVRADLAYGREQFGARLRYHWRGKSLKSSFSDSGLSVWNRPVGSLDLNMGWQLNSNVQAGLSARNLLNEEQVQTTDYSGQLLRYRERFRQVILTFRATW